MKGWRNWLIAALGGIIYALSIELFYLPANITTGGLTGISIILYRLFGTPVGVVAMLLNLPLFMLGFWKLGNRFGFSSLYGAGVSYLATDLLAMVKAPAIKEIMAADPLLSCLFGGLFMGVGLGLVFISGATTGGTDIAAALISRKYPHLTMGRLILIADLLIIGGGVLVGGDMKQFLYGCVALFLSSRAIDAVIYGIERGTAAFIVTTRPDDVRDMIFSRLDRGVTQINATGGYTGEEKQVLLCAISRSQSGQIKRLVHEVDPAAFVVLTEANEVYGNGFGEQK